MKQNGTSQSATSSATLSDAVTGAVTDSPLAPPTVSATVSTTEARNQLSAYVNRAAYGNEAIVLSRHGQPEAVLVSMAFYQHCLNLLAKAK